MKAAMTVRERMLAAYTNNPVDHPALGIYQRYLPRGSAETEVRALGVGLIHYYPAVTMLAPPWHFYEGFLSEVRGVELEVRYAWEHGVRVEQRFYHTPVGDLFQESCLDAGGVGSEHIRKHYITCIEDYKIMQYIVEHTVFADNHSHIQHSLEDLGDAGVLLGRMDRSPYQKCLIELAGPEQFLVDLFTDKEEVEALLGAMDYRLTEAFTLAVDTPADLFWQPDNITSDMTPPDAFETYCLPFYQKQASQIAQTGKPYLLHIDGKFKQLAKLLAKSGISGIESISVPEMGGDLTLADARTLLSDMVLIPNFPSNLSERPAQEIMAFLDSLPKIERPLMLQVSEDIPPHTWKRVLPILCDALSREKR